MLRVVYAFQIADHRSLTSTNNENIEAVRSVIRGNRRLTVQRKPGSALDSVMKF